MTNDPSELADLLRELYLRLEDEGLAKTADYGLARGLEDQLGSGQNISEVAVANAQALLRKHGFN